MSLGVQCWALNKIPSRSPRSLDSDENCHPVGNQQLRFDLNVTLSDDFCLGTSQLERYYFVIVMIRDWRIFLLEDFLVELRGGMLSCRNEEHRFYLHETVSLPYNI